MHASQTIRRVRAVSLAVPDCGSACCVLFLVHEPRLLMRCCHADRMQVWAKPPGASPLTFHRDSAYFDFVPSDVITVWLALDDMLPELGPLEVPSLLPCRDLANHRSPPRFLLSAPFSYRSPLTTRHSPLATRHSRLSRLSPLPLVIRPRSDRSLRLPPCVRLPFAPTVHPRLAPLG